MIRRILQVFMAFLLPLLIYGSSNPNEIYSVEDLTSPLTKEAIQKRNLKIHEIASGERMNEWNKSERKRIGIIENWEEDQIRKEMENFTLWSGGAVYEKKVGVFVLRFGTWGEKDGASLFRIEW